MIYLHSQKNRGYTLLFAVLLSSLILSIGISILTISRKELILSSSSRESLTSFFSADTGVECVMYHLKASNNLPEPINCNGYNIDYISETSTPNTRETGLVDETGAPTSFPPTTTVVFELKLGTIPSGGDEPLDVNPCANVTVTRGWSNPELEDENPNNDSLSVGNRLVTTIESRGYNTCDENNPRRTERGVRVRF